MIKYEHALLFSKLDLVGSFERISVSIYVIINYIHNGHVVPFVMTALMSNMTRLGFSNVL